MKTLLLVGLVATTAFAQAPDTLSGLVYRENVRGFLTSLMSIVSLHDDGTYTSIMIQGTFSRYDSFANVQPQDQGTYTYERTGPNTGTLSFTSSPGGGMSIVRPRQLVFTTDKHGNLTSVWGYYDADGQFYLGTAADTAIVNISTRGWASASKPMIVGFYVSDRPRSVLLRAIGPSLAQFDGVEEADDAILELVQHTVIPNVPPLHVINDDWGIDPYLRLPESAAMPAETVGAFVGAFPLEDGSKDAATVVKLTPGSYTMVIRTKSEVLKEVLGEVYVVP
ncbi:MAG TPA: hypothetical protein VIK52_07770 [Opitutaceae bacterium]